MLDTPRTYLRATPPRPLPIETIVRGKTRDEVATLLPRLFNLCRAAQGLAVSHALDVPTTDTADTLRQEIIRDHVLRLTMVLPGHFGGASVMLPRGWQSDGDKLRKALFGSMGRLPQTLSDFEGFLFSGEGIAGIWSKIDQLLPSGEAVTDALPYVSLDTASDPRARVENSSAARVARHPVVAAMCSDSRSLLWRVVARSYDLEALLDGADLPLITPKQGLAHVPATRGLYTVSASHNGTQVTDFARVTPTDHLCAPGGVLDQTLASLPVTRAVLVPLVMDILDPCAPVSVEEASNA